MKTIVITGGGGFIGSHIVSWLFKTLENQKVEYNIIILDKRTDYLTMGKSNYLNYFFQKLDKYQKQNFLKNIIFKEIDLVDESLLDLNILNHRKIDLCIHLASTVGVESVINQEENTSNDLSITLNIFKFCKQKNIPLLFSSTSEIYGNNSEIEDFSESKIPGNKRGSYASQKLVSEYIFNELPVFCSMRLFNITGIGQESTSGMVFPKFINNILNNEPIFLNKSTKRIFSNITSQYVKLPIEIIIQCLLDNDVEYINKKIFNIGLSLDIIEMNSDLTLSNLVNQILLLPEFYNISPNLKNYKTEKITSTTQYYNNEINERILKSSTQVKKLINTYGNKYKQNYYSTINYNEYLRAMVHEYYHYYKNN